MRSLPLVALTVAAIISQAVANNQYDPFKDVTTASNEQPELFKNIDAKMSSPIVG